jgi:hypothetical protein
LVYDLPRFAGQNWLVRGVFGNWQFNDITTFQSGKPINVTMSADVAGISRAGNQRPNLVGKPSADCNTSHISDCIDITAFATPDAFTLGNAGRNILTGPSYLNTDLSLFKVFPLRERMKLEFRAEFFNAFNRPQLANPDATIGDSFGQIQSTVADNREVQFGLKFVF